MSTSTELFDAHRQWASRPSEERFQSVQDMHDAVRESRRVSRESSFRWNEIEVGLDVAGEVVLASTKSNRHANLSAHAFGQLCAKVGAPRSYLTKLPAELAASCLTESLRAEGGTGEGRLLLRTRPGQAPLVRGITSAGYSRIWDDDILDRVEAIGGAWKLPMGYRDGKWGADLVPSGAYAGDRDSFLFMVDDTKVIDDGSDGGLLRGFFLWNSEVGAKSFGIKTFMCRRVCGNNIVWGSSNVIETRLRHVGEVNARAFAELALALEDYANASVVEDEAVIARAQTVLLGKDDAEVAAKVVAVTGLTAKTVGAAHKLGSEWTEIDGHPSTVWGSVNALTRYAQFSAWTEDRLEIETAAAKLMALAA